MFCDMGVAQRIVEARDRAGLSQVQMAERLSVGQSTVATWERGKNEPTLKTIERIAKITKMSAEWIAFGKSAAGRLTEAVQEIEVRAGAGGAGNPPYQDFVETDADGKSASADAIKGLWNFPEGYVRRELRADPAKVRIIELQGDSMSPTLETGDRVMVNSALTLPSPAGLFAIFDGFGIVVKRLELIPNSDPPSVEIISDNTKHKAYTRTLGEIHIIGRVVWFARRL